VKEFKIIRTSWHYRIANIPGYSEYRETTDICRYTRDFIIGCIYLIGLSAVALAIWYFLISAILGIGFSLYYSTFLMTEAGFAGLASLSFVLIWAAIHCLSMLKDYYLQKRMLRWIDKKDTPPGFLKQAYLSWKEKYCVRVKFLEEQHADKN
jgi:hypothetical protein